MQSEKEALGFIEERPMDLWQVPKHLRTFEVCRRSLLVKSLFDIPEKVFRRVIDVKAPGAPFVLNIYKRILDIIEKEPDSLNMRNWECSTSRCLAGWAVYMSGNAGAELKEQHGWSVAGAAIFAASDLKLNYCPNFYAHTREALDFLQERLQANEN